MRMWMINPVLLCTKHLVGEHGEIHKHLPSFRKGHKIDGRMHPVVQIQLNAIQSRHDELAQEIDRRNPGGHKSPLVDVPDLERIYPEYYHLVVDTDLAKENLIARCKDCMTNLIMSMSKQ